MKQPKIRLLIAFHEMGLGGIQKKTVDIIKYVQKKYPKTEVRLCLRRKEGIFLNEIPQSVVVSAPKYHFYRLGVIWYIVWMVKEILIFNPTHILAFMDFSAIPTFIALNILFWKRPKVTIGEDILTSKYLSDIYSSHQAPIRQALIKKYYPRASTILVQTPIQKADLENILGLNKSSKIIATPNWLPLDYPPTQKCLSPKSIDVLFVGRIAAQKNLPKFITIIKSLQKKIPNIQANIVGSGTDEIKINKLISSSQLRRNITMSGSTNNPQQFYTRSKVFLLTSDYEGFPLTLMEAISCGCFPICQNLPEIKLFFDKFQSEILFDDTKTAVNLAKEALTNTPHHQEIVTYYKKKLTLLQEKNINLYTRHCLAN